MNKFLPFAASMAAFVVLGGAPRVFAQTTAVATGPWSSPSTWSAGLPTDTLSATINDGQTVSVGDSGNVTNLLDVGTASGGSGTLSVTAGDLTITDTDKVTEPNLPSIRIGQAAGSTGTFNMSGGAVFIDGDTGSGFANGDLIVGDVGTGVMNMTGGDLTAIDEMQFGIAAGSSSTVNVSGGTLHTSTSGRSILVGFGGNGALNVSGTGAVTANFDLLVAFQPGSTGAVSLADSGSITCNFMFSNSFTAAPGSTATLTQTGGTFTSNIAFVMGQGQGTTTFNHSGGAVNIPVGNGDFVVSDGAGNTSTYNISGTASVAASKSVILGTFDGANGTVNQTGGSISAGTNIRIGADGIGTWNQSAGTIGGVNMFLGDFDTSNGTMTISGGTLNLSGDLNVGSELASNAPADTERQEPNPALPFPQQGQALDANGTFIVSGTGGDINVSGNLLADPDDKSDSRKAGADKNDSTLRFILSSTGVSTIDVGLIADLDGAVIDINDAAGYFTANPAASLTLISAAGGFGNVHTLLANELAGTGKGFSLDPADVSAFNLAIVPRSGGGENLVLTKGAGGIAGDADGDGDVDGNDFLVMQRNGYTPAQLSAFQANFGMHAVTPTAAAVPEPQALALVLLGGAAMVPARRRQPRV